MGWLSGLFGGGSKSSSSSSTKNTTTNTSYQETNTQQASLSNVVTDGAVVSGSGNYVTTNFSPEVARLAGEISQGAYELGSSAFDLIEGAFENIADLTGETIENLETTNARSIDAVIQANQQVQNPTFNALADTVNKTIPLAMFAIGAFVIVKSTPTIIKAFK